MLTFKEYTSNQILEQAVELYLAEKYPLTECIFRYGSEKFFEFFIQVRSLYKENQLDSSTLSETDIELLESDLGEFDYYQDTLVALDFIMQEESETPELNKIHRGGSKKFYVFVRDPATKNIKKISFGDTTGLSVKYNNPERKAAFAARHNCSDKTDKTTAGYWACRVNQQLGTTDAARRGYW